MFNQIFKTRRKKLEKKFLRDDSTTVVTSEYGPPIFNRNGSKLTRRWEKERYKIISNAQSTRSEP